MATILETIVGEMPKARRDAVDAFKFAERKQREAESELREAQYNQSRAFAELIDHVEPWELVNAISPAQAKSIVRRLAAE